MQNSKRILNHAVATALSLGLATLAAEAVAKPEWQGHEKCAGIVKKGMNDCGTSTHQCAGQAKRNGAPGEWMYLPAGTCKKIVGARIYKPAK
jgi:uncharacterized membrane protein